MSIGPVIASPTADHLAHSTKFIANSVEHPTPKAVHVGAVTASSLGVDNPPPLPATNHQSMSLGNMTSTSPQRGARSTSTPSRTAAYASPTRATFANPADPTPPSPSTPGSMAAHGHPAPLPSRLRLTHQHDDSDDPMDSSVPPSPVVPDRPASTNGTGLILRIPASAVGTPGATRGESPATPVSGGKRKRREPPPPSTRPRRSGRGSSPGTTAAATPVDMSRDNSSAPSSRATPAVADTPGAPAGHALNIFNAPASNDIADEVKTIVGPSAGRVLRDRQERSTPTAEVRAARPSRGGETTVRSGISGGGQPRRVGGTTRTAKTGQSNGATRTAKGKGKADEYIVNQDFCSVCRGIGRFLCCDGCPKSFHFMCLDPPLRIDELPAEDTWYCNECRTKRSKTDKSDAPIRMKDKPIATIFKTLVQKTDSENPQQFRLPQEIRSFFTGVATGNGGEYVDSEGARVKVDRKGFQEERDPIRMRDAKHRPVSCYKCGGSSIPKRALASDPEAQWRQIVSCDYCSLHWHLDCLSPPLASMPPSSRKWMCPNHADQVMPRRRTVRTGLETVDVEDAGSHNNGNIVVVSEEPPSTDIPHEDMVINNRRYRVPEKIIQLDFWNKLHLGRGAIEAPARAAKRQRREQEALASATRADLDAASLLMGLFAAPVAEATEPVANGTPAANGTPSARVKVNGDEVSTPRSAGSEGSARATRNSRGTPDGGPRRITLRVSRPSE